VSVAWLARFPIRHNHGHGTGYARRKLQIDLYHATHFPARVPGIEDLGRLTARCHGHIVRQWVAAAVTVPDVVGGLVWPPPVA
jgi:hypothetical protein